MQILSEMIYVVALSYKIKKHHLHTSKRSKGIEMNYGKLNEDIYERSVVKVIKNNSIENKKFYHGAGIGDFCVIFPYENDNALLSAQASAGGKHAVKRAYEAALNGIAARCGSLQSGHHTYAQISLFAPERLREIKVREMLAETAQRADELQIPIMGVNVQVLPWIGMETAVCVIHAECRDLIPVQRAAPGEDIVMTKWIGLEGTALIAESNSDRLKERYPSDLVDEAADFLRYASVLREAATAVKSGASYMQAVREGGIFKGLWELAANNSVGLVADLKSIPVRQETIEVCEYFDLNPYELMAGGSLLFTAPNGKDCVQKLMDEGISAAVIGTVTEGNDRIIRHEDESRFLEPAKGDEIYKIDRKG